MKRLLFFLICNFLSFFIFSQQQIVYKGSKSYTLRERTDLRRYDNGKYTGLVCREVTSFINPVESEDDFAYEGSFFVNQKTNRNQTNVGFGISDYIFASFKIDSKGNTKMIVDNGFPTFRNFPAFPEKKIKIGDSWTAKAERAVDPLNKGIITKMPIYVQYQYIGDEEFYGEPVFLISAQWATRYGMGSGTSYIDWNGDSELQKATGMHKATMYVSKKTGNAVVIRDSADETFIYNDGNQIQFKGTVSLFTEYQPAADTKDLLPVLKRICELTDEQTENLFEKNSNQNAQIADALIYKEDLISDNSNYVKNHKISTNYSEEVVDSFKDYSTENDKNNLQKIQKKLQQNDNTKKSKKENSINIDVEKNPAGIKLSVKNLQFKPDSAELSDSEKGRLSQIAEILNTVPQAKLLVEGHTAKTGNDKGEMQLSKERANEIAKALTKLGINSDRFICRGYGSTKPIADNSTQQGKEKNRRVEITILD